MNASKENRIAVVMEKHLEKAMEELSLGDEFVDCYIISDLRKEQPE